MNKIIYKFADGIKQEVEVSEEFYQVHLELLKKEKRNHRKETRRHKSLEMLIERGVYFEDKNSNPETIHIKKTDDAVFKKALMSLLPPQRELIEKVFFKNMSLVEIAASEGVVKSAITNRLTRIFEKLKNFLN